MSNGDRNNPAHRGTMQVNSRSNPVTADALGRSINPVRLPMLVVIVHEPREGSDVRAMVNAAKVIWRIAGIEIVPDFRTVDHRVLGDILVNDRYSRERNPLPVLPTPDLYSPLRASLERGNAFRTRPDDFYDFRRTGQAHPWLRLRNLVEPSSKRIIAYFIRLEHGVGITDLDHNQIFIQEEAKYTSNNFFRDRITMPTGRTLAHELGHILLKTGRHPEDRGNYSGGSLIPRSGLMRQDSIDTSISSEDVVLARRTASEFLEGSGSVIFLDRSIHQK